MTKLMENNSKDTVNIAYDRVLSIEMAEKFIEWKNNLHSEIRGSKLMFDVPKYYKWIEEKELLTYFINFVNYCG